MEYLIPPFYQSVIVAMIFFAFAAAISATLDNFFISKGTAIQLTYKTVRGIIAVLVAYQFTVFQVREYGMGFWTHLGALILMLDTGYIVFELALNKLRDKPPFYISDDGINHSTSWDDDLFHRLGRYLYGKRGPRYSGKLKFIVKMVFLVLGIILVL